MGLLSNTPENFVGGQTAYFHEQWSNLTSDPWVLNQIRGITIPFETLPVQISVPFPYRMNEVETAGLGGLLGQLLSKGVVGRSPHEEGEWISNVFLRPKPGGEYRMILDLTELNKFIVYEHFKMFSLQTAVELVEEGCWMASVDLKDAYYSVSVSRSDRKYLKFCWKGILYEFRAIPNGLACAPRFFTKILTPIYAGLRQAGHELFPFIDDSFVIVINFGACSARCTLVAVSYPYSRTNHQT